MPWIDLPLFTTPTVETPYRKESATSKAGARQGRLKAETQAERVLRALDAGPRTLHELAAITGLPLATICARVGGLKKLGKVEAAGEKRGPFGVENTLWKRA